MGTPFSMVHEITLNQQCCWFRHSLIPCWLSCFLNGGATARVWPLLGGSLLPTPSEFSLQQWIWPPIGRVSLLHSSFPALVGHLAQSHEHVLGRLAPLEWQLPVAQKKGLRFTTGFEPQVTCTAKRMSRLPFFQTVSGKLVGGFNSFLNKNNV